MNSVYARCPALTTSGGLLTIGGRLDTTLTMATARADTPSRGNQYAIPDRTKARVLGGLEELSPVEKPVPQPGPTEALLRMQC